MEILLAAIFFSVQKVSVLQKVSNLENPYVWEGFPLRQTGITCVSEGCSWE